MKHVKKTNIQKKRLVAVILAAVMIVALIGSLIVRKAASSSASGGSEIADPPEIIDGEARQNGLALAYPMINEQPYISFIKINNETGEYGFTYSDELKTHTLYYIDSNGKQQLYYPDICIEDTTFNYASLFAIDTSDGFGQYTLLDYLCLAIRAPYFDARIPIETDEAKRKEQLKNFGFDEENPNTVAFTYTDELGTTYRKSVRIGEKSVMGTGYYFIVYEEGVERPYIYSSRSNYYDYALTNMNDYVKPLLVSPGLSEDKGYEPYLTTGYHQWLNSFHDGNCECDRYECECRGNCEENCNCTDVCRVTEVTENTKVIVYADTLRPSLSDNPDFSGVKNTGYGQIELDLWTIVENLNKLRNKVGFVPNYESRNYERALMALVGKSIGKYEGEKEIIFSFVTPSKLIDFGNSESVRYEYRISGVSAVITDSGEITEPGRSAGSESDLIKIVYTATLDGKEISSHKMQAVLDLTSQILDTATENALRDAKIGDELDISLSVDYTSENAVGKTSKYVITEIIDIFDQDGKTAEKIAEDSIVGYRYEVYIDGELSGEATYWLDLSKVSADADLKLKKAILGKKVGKTTIEFDEYRAYYECFLGFTTYKISEIDSFLTRSLISSFKFQNSSERDPYYGESIYENLMTDEHRLYGLNASICDQVVRILGGVSSENTTGTAAGLAGDKVHEIGLTPEVMKKYGLYKNTVYFELPRGIKGYSASENSTDLSDLDDYTFRSTLGFYLYVSDVDPETNTRYIASDKYKIVTRVAADDFVFLDYDFESFWARRNLLLVDISYMANVGIEFSMSDLEGQYNFELTQPANKKTDSLGVYVTASGECTPNKFTEFISDPKNADLIFGGGTSLKTLYLHESGADSETHKDAYPNSLGAACFGDLIRMLFNTSYTGILSEEERAVAPDSAQRLMRITLELDEDVKNASPYTYVFEFFRIDDRRVRVSIYQQSESGILINEAVSDFYVSTYAFKKIVSGFVAILNAEVIDIDFGYRDMDK